MRLATVRHNGGNRAARVDGESVVLLPFDDVGALLAVGEDWREQAAATDGEFSRALIGAEDDIVLSPVSDRVDWKVELTVVIGKPLRYAAEAEARSAIAGYTIANDVSMRDWQTRTSQFLAGKTFEATTPLGPYLVTPDEADDGRSLQIELSVDGEVRQRESTDGMIFNVTQLLCDISSIVTLMPGDLILTGTCAGVGHCMSPQQYLVPGSVVEATIEHLGSQRNRCVAGRR